MEDCDDPTMGLAEPAEDHEEKSKAKASKDKGKGKAAKEIAVGDPSKTGTTDKRAATTGKRAATTSKKVATSSEKEATDKASAGKVAVRARSKKVKERSGNGAHKLPLPLWSQNPLMPLPMLLLQIRMKSRLLKNRKQILAPRLLLQARISYFNCHPRQPASRNSHPPSQSLRTCCPSWSSI